MSSTARHTADPPWNTTRTRSLGEGRCFDGRGVPQTRQDLAGAQARPSPGSPGQWSESRMQRQLSAPQCWDQGPRLRRMTDGVSFVALASLAASFGCVKHAGGADERETQKAGLGPRSTRPGCHARSGLGCEQEAVIPGAAVVVTCRAAKTAAPPRRVVRVCERRASAAPKRFPECLGKP